MIKYPNGKIIKQDEGQGRIKRSFSSANRGMDLEKDIELSNEYYKRNNICIITKRPTPIKVVKVDYKAGCKITEAYFEKQSTTDFNGVYMGKYIDFEAKSTISKTSFPLSNIHPHQIEHLENVLKHGGIAFFIIEFQAHKEVYYIDASFVINFYKTKSRSSIPYNVIKENSKLIKWGINPRLDYIKCLDF